MTTKSLLHEPLLHFAVLGAALFAAFSVVSNRDTPGEQSIVVSAGKIEHLAALFGRTWQRPPTREELKGLINDHVREEVAYREGMAIGLDRDDTIIRRRIRQKLEFVAEDLSDQIEPSEDELNEYLREHADDFRIDPRLTFRHVYLNADKRSEAVEKDARELLIALNADASLDASQLGDRIMLEHGYADVPLRDVAGLFGTEFAGAIEQLDFGKWVGPIRSGYGLHLVRIDAREQGRLPELSEARGAVRRDWEHASRQRATEAFYDSMLERYEVVIEWPEPVQPGDDR